jgi:hypothetical protein
MAFHAYVYIGLFHADAVTRFGDGGTGRRGVDSAVAGALPGDRVSLAPAARWQPLVEPATEKALYHETPQPGEQPAPVDSTRPG